MDHVMEAVFEKKQPSRVKITVVVIVLIAAALYAAYYAISSFHSAVIHAPPMIDIYYKKAKQFSEEENVAIKKNHAGYWVYNLDMIIAGNRVKKADYLEIKDNGIIWQVVEWTLPMPSGVVTTFYHIRTVYCNPFGTIGRDTLNDVCTIIQAFIAGSDTCFGARKVAEIWEAHKTGETMTLCGRMYTPYTGDIAEFFPRGMIGFVDAAERQFLRDSAGLVLENDSIYCFRKVDRETGKVSLFPIIDSLFNFSDRFQKELFAAYGSRAMKSSGIGDVVALLDKYYQPFLVEEKWRAFPRPLPREIKASFTVTTEGTVEKIRLPDFKTIGKIAYHGMLQDIMYWRFPPPDTSLRVTYTFKMP